MDYYEKYLKYKNKYIDLKNLLTGGDKTSDDITSILNKLYIFLDQNKICFDKGAFVFELDNDEMSKKLKDIYNSGITRKLSMTHNYYQSNDKHYKQRICNPNDCVPTSEYTIKGMPMKEIKILLVSNCTFCNTNEENDENEENVENLKCEKVENVPKEVVLMYLFNVSYNNMNKEYMYLKLETKGTTNILDKIIHGVSAIKRYILKSEIENLSRREDNIKDYKKNMKKFDYNIYKSETLQIVEEDNNKMINIFTDNTVKMDIKKNMDFYTKYVRTGRELYIPSLLMGIIFNKVIIV